MSQETVLNLGSVETHPGALSLFLTLVVILIVLAAGSFGVGYVVGQIQTNQPESLVKEAPKTVTNKDGSKTYSSAHYSISFGPEWKLTEKKAAVESVLIEKADASVEIWSEVPQPVSLSAEQKSSITATKQTKFKVNGEEEPGTEYSYNTGAFFSTVVIPETEDTAEITFWIKADSDDSYNAAKSVLESFKFK